MFVPAPDRPATPEAAAEVGVPPARRPAGGSTIRGQSRCGGIGPATATRWKFRWCAGYATSGLGWPRVPGWLLCLRLACAVSLFLMLFAVSMTGHPAVMAVLGLYTATGSVWLMLAYWAGLKSSVFVASDQGRGNRGASRGGERLPWIGLSLLVLRCSAVAG